MSSKTTTTSSGNNATAFQFDPASLKAYHDNLSTYMPVLQGFATNPFNNQQFNFENTLGQNNAAKLGQRAMSNIVGNSAAAGYGANMPGYMAALQNSAARGTSALQANAFNSAMLNAGNRQMQSLGMLQAFQPLMTGSTGNYSGNQTQTTGGLGTWLPQLAGAAIGGAMNAFMPGASALTGSTGGSAIPSFSSVPVTSPDFSSMSGSSIPGGLFAGIGSAPPPRLG